MKNVTNKLTDLPLQRWRGESLLGKSLLIWQEHGFGDYIQFVRYVPLIRQRGVSKLTLVCAPPLKPLLETMEGVDKVITKLTSIDFSDYWSFPLSLPLHFATDSNSIPANLPYLHSLPERIEKWRNLIPKRGLKVGLVWKDSNDSYRSVRSLCSLAPLWEVQGVTFVSLQKNHGEDEAIRSSATQPIIHLGTDIMDFADTAAIVAQLDLVICVDTAIAHVAGAIGKPCWMLLPSYSDWRWLLNRLDSPWYPGLMRLFRNSSDDNWTETINEVAVALKVWVSTIAISD